MEGYLQEAQQATAVPGHCHAFLPVSLSTALFASALCCSPDHRVPVQPVLILLDVSKAASSVSYSHYWLTSLTGVHDVCKPTLARCAGWSEL